MTGIRIAIFADSRLFCEGLRRIMAADPSVLVVLEADSGSLLRRSIASASADVLVVDARLDGVLALCTELGRQSARPRVLLVAADAEEESATRALEAGARGILARDASGDDLVKAVRLVNEGQIWATKRVISRIVEKLAAQADQARAEQARLARLLTSREEEIVRCVANGLSNHEIADRLAISQATVKAHLSRIFQKLVVKHRSQLAAYYHRTLTPPQAR